MAPLSHLVHASRSLKETSAFWYPIIRDLGWNRSVSDGPIHYHAALDGQTWLLITPHAPSSSNSSTEVSAPESGSVSPELQPKGCILALPYANATGWIGFFIMHDAYRGQGLGGALWRSMDAIWSTHKTSIVGLDGVEEQVPTYTRRGFVDVGRIPLMSCSAADARGVSVNYDEALMTQSGGEFKSIKHTEKRELADLDLKYAGLDRGRYWISSDLLERGDVFGFAHYSDAKLGGFVLVRGCEEGFRVGPLFAPSATVAMHLLRLVMQHPCVAGSSGRLIAEVFGANAEAKKVFESLGWKDVGVEYHRMWYEGRVPGPQQDGGLGTKGMFAIFDAACG